MFRTILLILFLLTGAASRAQNDVLLLRRNNKTIRSFIPGESIALESVDGNAADGIITRIAKDSIFFQRQDIRRFMMPNGAVYLDTLIRPATVIHFKDIGAIIMQRGYTNRTRNGTVLMIAGGGVMVLGAVNGLYRGDPPKSWYQPSGYITAAALVAAGLLMRKSAVKRYVIGKKFHLKILPLTKR